MENPEEASYPDEITAVLEHEGIDEPELLGKGGEGHIFVRSDTDVIKIYPGGEESYLEKLKTVHGGLARRGLSFETPRIKEIRTHEGTPYTVERRLSGTPMAQACAKATPQDRQTILLAFLDAAYELGTVEVSRPPFGDYVERDGMLNSKVWTEYLLAKLDEALAKSRERLTADVEDFDKVVDYLREYIPANLACEQKALVHNDFWPANVLVGEENNISAVMDYSVLAVIGDSRMDLCGALNYLILDDGFTRHDADFLRAHLKFRGGDELMEVLDAYYAYSAIFWGESATFEDPLLYEWVKTALKIIVGKIT
ncbi:phosphotransferase [Candidatus Poribacteria bacterium]|jgi:aminoglycoside phosphotransferase|nr:phosphotransferase [Candidatus Poribacteria bacterium]MBT7101345.1 phosphotransferase [Candidatus Poribacteria bacterium]MBT7807636.1 phosphotransferase [Candidatus Poribacteria bacterium]